MSDKTIEGKSVSECIDNINSYLFRYKLSAQKKHPDTTDDKLHLGIMAQELKENPLTRACVQTDESDGSLEVDTRQVALTDMALISDLAKRVKELEERLK